MSLHASPVQIVTTLTLTNPVPNLTLGISGALPDTSSGKVSVKHHQTMLNAAAVHTLHAQVCTAGFQTLYVCMDRHFASKVSVGVSLVCSSRWTTRCPT